MLAILTLLGVLVWEVSHHRHRRVVTGESAIVENFARRSQLIA